jgi:(E)-4-hydroxy-3-methylbut-2-enyl-diphosphate synthase
MVGGVQIGGGAPIRVQSMTKTKTEDIEATISQIRSLEEVGCELVRVAIPSLEAAEAIPCIKRAIHIPLVADVHFDPDLAISAIEKGADKLRLNPGNIRDPESLVKIVTAAKERSIPIRIGVNEGSLPPDAQGDSSAQRMVNAALKEIRFLEGLEFNHIVVSCKAFDISTTVEAYKLLSQRTPYPLHVGITEAGPPFEGGIRSALGMGILLYLGIGDTIRVSLSAPPELEVRVGNELLECLNLRRHSPEILSCPTCGRAGINLFPIVDKVNQFLQGKKTPLKISLCACGVNGPGEARRVDVGMVGGKGKGAIFRGGKFLRTVEEDKLAQALIQEIEEMLQCHS